MSDEEKLDYLCDRFTAEELVELLDLTVYDICGVFRDQCLDINLEDI